MMFTMLILISYGLGRTDTLDYIKEGIDNLALIRQESDVTMFRGLVHN